MLNRAHLAPPAASPEAEERPPPFPSLQPPGYTGHPHFWQRALSRRQFVRTAAGATAMVVGSGLWMPIQAAADGDDDHKGRKPALGAAPNPIPGGLDLLGNGHIFHVFFPVYGQEVSTITDFNGMIAAAEIQGMGTGTDTAKGMKTRYFYDADMRVMDGMYIGKDGKTRKGAFGFV